MTKNGILAQRLANQYLTLQSPTRASEIVSWYGAMQAQDFPGAKWALGQRLNDATDETIQKAFDRGEILRTHVMRPTWHFVSPQDIRWMLNLTKPQVMRLMGSYNKKLELDESVFRRTQEIMVKLFEEKQYVTRQEIKIELLKHGIQTDIQRLAHIVMQAELDALICSGPLQGKQFTYALLEKRVAKSATFNADEALGELAKRYFQSHGPAQLIDFSWWSGLPMADSKKGIVMNNLESEEIDGKMYYFFENNQNIEVNDVCYLLPNYDEYTIAYKDRSAFFSPEHAAYLDSRGNSVFQHVILFRGKIIGFWKRIPKKDTVTIQTKFFQKLTNNEHDALLLATERFGKFLNLPVVLS